MFKLVVLSALIACSTAAPSLNLSPKQYAYAGPVSTYAAAAPVLLQEYQHVPAVAKVAEFVEHVPSSVSHQSSSVVHSSAAIATPVITPVKTVVTAPIAAINAAPIVEEVHEAQIVDAYHAAPVLKQVSAPAHDLVLQPQAYAKVAEFVQHVPSSVSHHSSSVVHSSAAVATPVITPVANTVVTTAPVYKAAPVIATAPVYKATPVIATAPVYKAAPVIATAPVYKAAPVAEIYQTAPIFNEVRAAANDIVEIRPEIHHAPATLAKVGEFVEHVPSSVSHHSSSVVHNSAAIATPVITPVAKIVVATAPVYKAPLLKTLHAPATYAVRDETPYYNSLPYAAYHNGSAYYQSEPIFRSW